MNRGVVVTGNEIYPNLKWLAVGTGRCGTGMISSFFKNNGVDCGHESIFSLNVRASSLAAEASWLAVPYLGTDAIKSDVFIIHLIRNPFEVIKSFYELGVFKLHEGSYTNKYMEYMEYIKDNTPETLFSGDEILDIARYVLYWNELIKIKSKYYKNYVYHRVEDNLGILAENINFSNSTPIEGSKRNLKAASKKRVISVEYIKEYLKKDKETFICMEKFLNTYGYG